MKNWWKPRVLVVILLMGPVLAVAVTVMRLLIAWSAWRRWDGARRLHALNRANTFWCSALFRVMAHTGGMTLDLPAARALPPSARPVFVIANHRSEFDVLLLAEVCRRLGLHDVKWVAKDGLGTLPFAGRVFREVCTLVSQGRHPVADLKTLLRDAKQLRRAGAGLVLFPEGTTWTPTQAKPEWHGLLPPHAGAFVTVAKQLPDHPIVTLVVSYGRPVGDCLTDLADYLGCHVSVRAFWHEPLVGGHEAWLMEEWRRVERALAALSPNV